MPKFRQSSEGLRRAIISVGIFLGVIAIFWVSLQITWFANIFQRVEAGVVRVGTGIGNTIVRVTSPEETTASKFSQCEAELRSLAIESADYEALKREVSELRATLAYTDSTDGQGVVAQVIARAVDDDATLVLIDKGSTSGLVLGSAAVIDNGVLYGIVEEVRSNSSVIRLVANSNATVPAAVLGKGRTIGLVEGRGGALLFMDFIPQDAEIGTGNLVVTSGLDGFVRQGLVIGLVTELVTVPSAPFKQAYIELLYEPREWTTVLVLPPPGL
jgi:rod shape-determining protein MreC